jgi:hypothetical protein
VGDLTLVLDPDRYAVCRLPADAALPELPAGTFASVTRTPDELSVVCREDLAPDGATVDGPWRLLRLAGTQDLAQTGILASLVRPLAMAGVPVFALATYDTDWLLLPADRAQDGLAALAAAGHAVR